MDMFVKWQQKLPVQILTTLIGLVFLTAFAIGIPALWILRNQLERQAWTLVNQGSQTSLAVLSNRQSDLTNLAILTAQRPTLRALVEQDNQQELEQYLRVLQEGAGLDLLLLCGQDQQILIYVGEPVSDKVCLQTTEQSYYDREFPGSPRAWLLGASNLPLDGLPSHVFVGIALDDEFFAQLSSETGLEKILVFQGEYIASSFTEGRNVWESMTFPKSTWLSTSSGLPFEQIHLTEDDTQHFANRMPYGGGLELIVSRPISDILQANRQLSWIIGAVMASVVVLSSVLGIARSRRISLPLEKLKEAADDLRKGKLSRSIRVNTQIHELKLLSFALEDARIAINHSMMELSREKAWTELVLESVVDGIITIDKRLTITFFSRGAEEITGWKQEHVLGMPIDDIFPLDEAGETFSQRLSVPGSKQKIEVRLRNGKPATLAVSCAQIGPPEAGKAGTAFVIRDVSSEEAIRRLLGEFLANISHEFRTPLSALAASIELLLEQLSELQPSEVEELLNNIHLGIISLQHLIDNLLEGASIETGRFKVFAKPAAAGEILHEAARIVQPLVDKYGLTLRSEWPDHLPEVQADFRRTVQVMVNLLSNAVKWSPSGSEILVSAIQYEEALEVCVADHGPGIPPEILPNLFHRFVNAQGGERADQGMGLGLSVVKAIVEAQGGQVGVRNRPAGGAAFWFTLRYAPTKVTLPEEQS